MRFNKYGIPLNRRKEIAALPLDGLAETLIGFAAKLPAFYILDTRNEL